MVPSFDHTGNLPPGTYTASWNEVVTQFGFNPHRTKLLDGLKKGIAALRAAGCKIVYLDGSFVSSKPRPSDFDVCWVEAGVDLGKLDPVLQKFDNKREAQKKKYLGEFFPATTIAQTFPRMVYVEFFQFDKYTNLPKGIVKLNI